MTKRTQPNDLLTHSFPKALRQYYLLIGMGLVMAILGAFLSSILVLLVGPALQLLANLNEATPQTLKWAELFGPYLGTLPSLVSGKESVSGQWLFERLPILLLTLSVLKTGLQILQSYLWEFLGESFAYKLRNQLVDRMLNTTKSPNTQHSDLGFSPVISNDVRVIKEYLSRILGGVPRELLQLIFMMAMLVLLSPSLFLIFLVVFLPSALILKKTGKTLLKRSKVALSDFSILSRWLNLRLNGIDTIKQLKMESHELQTMNHLNQTLSTSMIGAARTKARTAPIIEWFSMLSFATVLFIALGSVAAGFTPPAAVMSFFVTIAMMSQSTGKLGRYYNSQKEAKAARDRIATLWKQFSSPENMSYTLGHPSAENGLLSCENMSIGFEKSKILIRDFTFNFSKEKIYGLHGPSGSGKSTFLATLLGLHTCQSGTFQFADNVRIGFIPQEPWIIPGTIAENITYPNSTIMKDGKYSSQETQWISKCLQEVGLELNQNQYIDSHTLSGGEAQRLHWARLLFHRYNLLLVDEGTSALDPKSEVLILKLLKKLRDQGVAMIIVAHKSSVLDSVDELVSI